MSRTLPNPDRSDPVRSLDEIRPKVLKAGLPRSDSGPTVGPTIGDTVKAVLIDYFGTVQGAAYALGEGAGRPRLDPSLMMREFDAGKLARLEVNAVAKALVFEALYKTSVVETPKARALRLAREAHDRIDALEHIVRGGE